ncbi:MAG: agmatinase [Polyangiales bacterium]
MSDFDPPASDRAFAPGPFHGMGFEAAYAGAPSFLRRRWSKALDGVDVAVVGVPLDLATSHRPGARLGPAAIRAASAQLAWGPQWPWGFDPFATLAVADWGDIAWDFGRPETMPDAITQQAVTIGRAVPRVLALGGDHFVTLPLLRAQAALGRTPLSVVHFDAHCDTWKTDQTPGRPARIDHGSFMWHAVDEGLVAPERSIQVGLRTHADETLGFHQLDAEQLDALSPDVVAARICEVVGAHPVYLTFDIDCLDPAYAPGTGTPVVGGPTTARIRAILRRLAGIRLIGMDVVEVSPPFDHAQLTSLAAASIAFDLLCLAARSPADETAARDRDAGR